MEESSSIYLEGRADCIECTKALIGSSTQQVYIISGNLDAVLYNDKEIYDHLAEMATKYRKTEIRIIAHDTRPASRDGHFLIHLSQKLPTFVNIRITVLPPDKKFRESWLIVDKKSFMRIQNPQRYEGYYEIDNKLECRTYIDKFNEIWEASKPDQNTRRLSL
jgi:hypothetical protein